MEKILITGSGTFANAMTEYLLDRYDITIYSRNEKMQYEMAKRFPNVNYIIGDIRDYEAIRKATIGMDYVLHSGAMKHIDKCEKNPEECFKTNIQGSINIMNACIDNKVKKIVLLSTDKATNPTTIYGCSKLYMEMYAKCVDNKDTKIITTRYGNVLGSNGSVLDIWRTQKANGQPLTITNPDATRFFMSIDQAIELVYTAMTKGKHKDLWVYQNKACTIKMLADCISDNQVVTEYRCVEKTDEALLTINELNHSEKIDSYYRVSNDIQGEQHNEPLTSDNAPTLTLKELGVMIDNA